MTFVDTSWCAFKVMSLTVTNGLRSLSVLWGTFPNVIVRTVRRRDLCMHTKSSTFANELSICRGIVR